MLFLYQYSAYEMKVAWGTMLKSKGKIQGELPPLSWPADLVFYRIQLIIFPTEGAAPFS